MEERLPSFSVPDRVIVGTTLPEAGVVYYDVPERYGATTYRYTVVNDRTVLVDRFEQADTGIAKKTAELGVNSQGATQAMWNVLHGWVSDAMFINI